MSRRRARMTARWARYFNHYSHIPGALVGGSAAARVVWTSAMRREPFRYIRRQANRRFAQGATR